MSVEDLAARKTRLDLLEDRLSKQDGLITELTLFNEGVVAALEALRDQNKALTHKVIELMDKA